jgi:hypothetical protein
VLSRAVSAGKLEVMRVAVAQLKAIRKDRMFTRVDCHRADRVGVVDTGDQYALAEVQGEHTGIGP